jgi:hypothetical protein
MSHVLIETADSQLSQARAQSVTMFRVNYRPPESPPARQRDFPARRPAGGIQRREYSGDDGSWQLALMVDAYLIAVCAGLVVFCIFTGPIEPNTATLEIVAGR